MLWKYLAHNTNTITMENTYVLFYSQLETQANPKTDSFSVHLLDAKQTSLSPFEFSGESDTCLPCLPYYKGHTLSPPCGSIEASVRSLQWNLNTFLQNSYSWNPVSPISKYFIPHTWVRGLIIVQHVFNYFLWNTAVT